MILSMLLLEREEKPQIAQKIHFGPKNYSMPNLLTQTGKNESFFFFFYLRLVRENPRFRFLDLDQEVKLAI